MASAPSGAAWLPIVAPAPRNAFVVTFELALEEQSPTPRAPPAASPWAQAFWSVVFCALIETPQLRDTSLPVRATTKPLVEAVLDVASTPARTPPEPAVEEEVAVGSAVGVLVLGGLDGQAARGDSRVVAKVALGVPRDRGIAGHHADGEAEARLDAEADRVGFGSFPGRDGGRAGGINGGPSGRVASVGRTLGLIVASATAPPPEATNDPPEDWELVSPCRCSWRRCSGSHLP